jgi:hypothetical protein
MPHDLRGNLTSCSARQGGRQRCVHEVSPGVSVRFGFKLTLRELEAVIELVAS